MKTRLVQLKEAAEAAAKSARGIAEKAAAENRDMTEAERKDFDDALAKGTELVEKFKTAKADEDVINAALSLAGDIGPDAKSDLESQDGKTIPPRERAKSLGLQIVESTQFKSAMEQFKDGRIPEGSRIHTSPIEVKGLFVGGADTSAGAFVVNGPGSSSHWAARNSRSVIWCRCAAQALTRSSTSRRPRTPTPPQWCPRRPARLRPPLARPCPAR